ncbi:MAG TPA: hypothetical protein VKR53_12475 [Puia sp.]|nr:hypothetical protein [Puia sp.]
MKKFLLSTLISFITLSLLAQDSTFNAAPQNKSDKKAEKRERINKLMRMEEEGDLIFNKHNIFGIKVATDGYGISFEKGKYKTPEKTTIFQFELNEKKSSKEKRLSAGDFSSVVEYKLNNFYEFKVAMGQQFLIGGKGNKNGVAVTALYTGGLSLAILKPYYINLIDQNQNQTQETWPQYVADPNNANEGVSGAAGFFVGWNHVSFTPGVNAKTALRFDYGRFNETITALEVGLTSEFYFSKIPQVYLVPYKQFFFNAFVAIEFGSRK